MDADLSAILQNNINVLTSSIGEGESSLAYGIYSILERAHEDGNLDQQTTEALKGQGESPLISQSTIKTWLENGKVDPPKGVGLRKVERHQLRLKAIMEALISVIKKD